MTSDLALQGDAAIQQKRLQAKRLLAKQKLLNNSPSYGTLSSDGVSEKITFGNNGQTVDAPIGIARQFSDIENDDVFDTPSSSFEEAGAQFEKQAAYISLVANAFGLVGDDEINDFIADRSKALASAQSRQPEYMKNFVSDWENSKGFFEGAGVIISNPRAIGRQVITQGANAAIPLLTTAGGAAAGTAVAPIAGSIVGGTAGAFVGGSIVEVGAELDGMISEAGYDVTNPDQVLAALQNEQLMESIRVKAAKKGLTTASVDALFQIVGGRFLKAAKVKGAGKLGTAGAAVADVGVQSAGEGIGEAAGQFAKDGTVDVKDAVLESITSLGQSVGQTAIGATMQGTKAGIKKTSEIAKVKVAEAKAKIDAVEIKENPTISDADNFEANIEAAERDIASAIAENQLIEIEQAQQAEIISEAESLKSQIDSIVGIEINDPKSLRKAIGYVPETITQFIKKTGGIKDANGELKTRGVTNKSVVGLISKENRETVTAQGKVTQDAQVDAVKQRVFDAGYFPDKTDYNEISDTELFDAISNDATGKKVYKADDLNKINEITQGSERAQQDFFERGMSPEMTTEQISDLIREERKLSKFTPKEKIDIGALEAKVAENFDKAVEQSTEAIKEENLSLKAPERFPWIKRYAKDFGGGVEKFTTPISTRIKNISPKLFTRLRKFEFDVKMSVLQDNQAVLPLIRKMSNLPEQVKAQFDLAMKNRNVSVINEIAQKYDMVQDVADARQTLDAIYKRATDAGIEINYLEDLFPRRIKDLNGLMDHIKKRDGTGTIINEALEAKKEALGRSLTKDEQATVVDTLLRGYRVEGVSLAKRGIFKERSIEQVTNELNKFYHSSENAILAYIYSSNESIETNKFFGKKGNAGFAVDATDSIGSLTNDLVQNDEITNEQAETLKEILNARFNPERMGELMSTVRDLGYIATMGSPLNAVTQFGDLATSMYNAGIVNTAKTIPAAALDKTRLTLADVGIEDIAQEFDNQNKTAGFVNEVFKRTGLNKIDRIGKLTLVNSAIKDAQRLAKKSDPKLMKKLEVMFDQNAEQVRQELANGEITENVQFYAFNTLLDFQPVALSEMPEGYLRGKNSKMFYMLKSFTLKQIDVYRREAFTEIKVGMETGNKKQVANGMKNFVRLASFWIIMGASADYMKDLIRSFFGDSEMEDLEDYVIENMYKAFGINKYSVDMMNRPYMPDTPADFVFNYILPPTKTIDNMTRDFREIKKNGWKSPDDLRTVRSIPIGGELYWFWFGGGSGDEKSKKSKDILMK